MVLGGDFENSLARGGEMWHNNELERAKRSFWAIGAAGAQVPYKHKVGGSNPSSTTRFPGQGIVLAFLFSAAVW